MSLLNDQNLLTIEYQKQKKAERKQTDVRSQIVAIYLDWFLLRFLLHYAGFIQIVDSPWPGTENRERIVVRYFREESADRSPCIRQCCLNEEDICVGCFRHLNEITGWTAATEEEKKHILLLCQQRQKSPRRG